MATCPLNRTCSTQKDGKEERCLWFIRMQNPQGAFYDVCAMLLVPEILRRTHKPEGEEKKNADK